jgi:perosamine synthetase
MPRTQALPMPVEDPERIGAAIAGNVDRFPGVIGTFMGRDALHLATSYLALGASDTVLLPVYTCQEVIKSFLGTTRVVFYDILPDLTVDPAEILAKAKGHGVKMLLLTNYFGFLQPYRTELRKICDDRGIRIIEDCAHSLLTPGSGDTGDLSIYSFRKILPVPDGGGLRVNSPGKAPAPGFYPALYSNAISAFIMAKSLLHIRSKMFSRAGLTSNAAKVLSIETPLKRDERILPLSYVTRQRMAKMSFPEVVKRRRADFEFWQEATRKNDSVVPVFRDLPPDVCPLGFPVRIKDRSLVESRARKRGIPLSVHWRLEETLGRECGTSHALSAEMLTLPIYPELGERGREALAGIVAQI